MKSAVAFSLQIDVSSCAQLIAFVYYIHKDVVKDELLFCMDLLSTTCAEDIYQSIDAFLRKMVSNRSSFAEFVLLALWP